MLKLGLRKAGLSLLAAASFATGAAVQAADHVWVIGGGPDVYGAGYHIEYNVNWVLEILRSTSAEQEIHVYFGAGGDGEYDVVEWSPPPEGLEKLQPLARVFDQQVPNGETYRQSTLTDITGSTRRAELIRALQLDFSKLRPGDRAFIVYNGHGLHDEKDGGGNSLRLWGDSRLSARDFESLLSKIEPSVPTRFLFPQCYSGGFARLIHPHGDDVLELAEGQRCGFMASSERRQSEGCATSTKLGDYRDYTTHFFAAFSGITKQGEAVTGDIDYDNDGRVTMYDAHLFALTQGYSRSMPRSTSETYLEKWQPWYLRWMGTGDEPDNLYRRLAGEVAHRLQLPQHGPALIAELHTRRKNLQGDIAALGAEKTADGHRISELQEVIQQALRDKWPAVRYPYTNNFLDFLSTELADAQTFILRQPDYRQLVELQDRQLAIDASVLKLERDTIELDKVSRLRKLARLKAQFEAHASDSERRSYEQLLTCEATTL